MAVRATENLKTAAAERSPSQRRRRLPSPAEQARRQAWGREWGGMIGAYWKQRAASGYTTGRR